ncbi:MAG TPA: hypothetical protein DCX17_00020 [Firmicutes bacterium]|jgi:nitrogen regulatory protein PII|nr:hypothetical protein [Bacillota bacterium]
MKLVVYVLIKVELLQKLLGRLAEEHISGATIIDSSGMGRELAEADEFSIFGSLRSLLIHNNRQTKTLLFVAKDEQVAIITNIVEGVVGKLVGPDSGIIFSVPIDDVKGYKTY